MSSMKLDDAIRSQIAQEDSSDPTRPAISTKEVQGLTREFSLPGWHIEAAALRMGIVPERYGRSMSSITDKEQIALLNARVGLVGLGGLGGTLLEQLARIGIGRIHATDGDRFEESNLNRQQLATMETLGTPKAQAAHDRCRKVNPSVEFHAEEHFLSHSEFHEFLDEADLAIDALGGLRDRLALQEAAAKRKIPLVTGALAGWTGYVAVVEPGAIGPASLMGVDDAAETLLGCPAPVVSVVASMMAREVVRLLVSKHSPLSGRMLIIDLESISFETVSL